MGDDLVALGHFHLTEADAATRAPGHGVIAAVHQAPLMALLEEAPDRVVILLRHREVAAPLIGRLLPVLVSVPVHPVTEADRLFGLHLGELVHALFTEPHETVDGGE